MSTLAVYKGKVYDSVDDLLLDIGKINEKSIYMTFGELTLLIPTEKEEVIKIVEKSNDQNEKPKKTERIVDNNRGDWSTRDKKCTDHNGVEYPSYNARARAYGLCVATINSRLKAGYSLKNALTLPKHQGYKKKNAKVG